MNRNPIFRRKTKRRKAFTIIELADSTLSSLERCSTIDMWWFRSWDSVIFRRCGWRRTLRQIILLPLKCNEAPPNRRKPYDFSECVGPGRDWDPTNNPKKVEDHQHREALECVRAQGPIWQSLRPHLWDVGCESPWNYQKIRLQWIEFWAMQIDHSSNIDCPRFLASRVWDYTHRFKTRKHFGVPHKWVNQGNCGERTNHTTLTILGSIEIVLKIN